MHVTIADPALQKAIFRILQGYEVNEQGAGISHDTTNDVRIIIDEHPLEHLRSSLAGETTLTIISARPHLQENEFVRVLLENSALRPYQLVYVGLSRMDKDEAGFLVQKNVRTYPMRQIAQAGHQEVCDAAMQASRMREKLVLLVDLSILDPAFFPGGEPGGMSTRELLYFLQRFRLVKNLSAIIITGFGKSDLQGSQETAALLAKLIAELS